MINKTFSLPASADGLNLSGLKIVPDKKPKAIVQLVHGMCEHKERYIDFMSFLASHGYACFIHDHRGHGASVLSPDDLGYFYKGGFRAMIDDIHIVTKYAKTQYPDIPLFLFGHSMGSMAVRSYAKRYDEELSGLIVCGSPSYNPNTGLGKVFAMITGTIRGHHFRPRLIQKMAFGAFNKDIGYPISPNAWICSDQEVVKAYDADPLCNFRFTANGFFNLFALMKDCYSPKAWKASNPDMPVKFIAGQDDPCIGSLAKFANAVCFMRWRGYRDVTSQTYFNMRHEILNEIGKKHVWSDILGTIDNWLASGNVPIAHSTLF